MCPSDVNVEALKTRLESMRRSVQRHEVADLILSLKQLIPDYNPSTQILKAAMSAQSQYVDPDKIKTSTAHNEIPVAVKLVPAEQIN